MEAMFFGRQPLFGIHHPARGLARAKAVLICPSWGLEALRSQRGLRLLADKLAENGFDTLRFDYSGTGDSFGDSPSLAQWQADIDTALRELRDLSGCEQVAVIGLRVGALLASDKGDALLAIDAPVDGASFVQQLKAVAAGLDAHKNRFRDQDLPAFADDELLGFDFLPSLATLPPVQHRKLQTLNTVAANWSSVGSQFSPWAPSMVLNQIVETLKA